MIYRALMMKARDDLCGLQNSHKKFRETLISKTENALRSIYKIRRCEEPHRLLGQNSKLGQRSRAVRLEVTQPFNKSFDYTNWKRLLKKQEINLYA